MKRTLKTLSILLIALTVLSPLYGSANAVRGQDKTSSGSPNTAMTDLSQGRPSPASKLASEPQQDVVYDPLLHPTKVPSPVQRQQMVLTSSTPTRENSPSLQQLHPIDGGVAYTSTSPKMPAFSSASSGPDNTVSGYWDYINTDHGVAFPVLSPIRYALMEVWRSGILGFPVFIGSTTTDGNGHFSFSWGESNQDVWVTIFSQNDGIANVFCPVDVCPVPDDLKPTYHQNSPTAHVDGAYDYGTLVVAWNPVGPFSTNKAEAFRIFDKIVTAWLYIDQQTGVSVPRVAVQNPCGPLCPTGIPYFNPYVIDDIYMPNSQNAQTIVHEYGHWVMWSAYGGGGGPVSTIWPVPLSEQLNCLTHFLERACGIHVGWTEGWADFLALFVCDGALVCNTPDGPFATLDTGLVDNPSFVDLETPPAQLCYSDGCHNFETGDSVEGRIATALWDLLDSHVDGKDMYGVGFGPIFDALWNGGRAPTFRDFYNIYRTRFSAPEFNAAAYQNTIDYNNAPRVVSISLPGLNLGWISGTATISVTASDDSGGYVDGYLHQVTFQYSTDNINWITISTLDIAFPGGNSPYEVAWNTGTLVDSSVWVRAIATDNLDAVANNQFGPFGADNTPPTGSILINGGAAITYSRNVALTLAATDPESGVWQMRFSNDVDVIQVCTPPPLPICFPPIRLWTAWESFQTGKSWQLSPFPASAQLTADKTVYVQYRNVALAESTGFSDSTTLAVTIRVVNISPDKQTYVVGDTVAITAKLEEQVDGVTIRPFAIGTATTKAYAKGGTTSLDVLLASVPMTLVDASAGTWTGSIGPIPPRSDPNGYQGTYILTVSGSDPPARTLSDSVDVFVTYRLVQGVSGIFIAAFSASKVASGTSFTVSVTFRNQLSSPATFTLRLDLPSGMTTLDPREKPCSIAPSTDCTLTWNILFNRPGPIKVDLLFGGHRDGFIKWFVRDPAAEASSTLPSQLQTSDRLTEELGV